MTRVDVRLPNEPDSAAAGRADAGALLVAETFVSIQGEGKLTGMPSWFVRLSGCNLRCAWCDTPYASWNPEGTRRTVENLVAEARASGVRHAVVTGGEPMMFPQVTELTAHLHAPPPHGAAMHITIETAGTVVRPVTCQLMSISPKLASSTPSQEAAGPWAERHESRRINIAALQALLDAHPSPGRQLKFVVTEPGRERDVEEIDSVLGRLHGWSPEDIMLMPEGVASPPASLRDCVASVCVARGWRYCHRLHIELYGNRRGT